MVRGVGFKKRTNVDKAVEDLISKIKRIGIEEVDVYNCCKRVLAEDIVAEIDIPPFDRAAMDGFAVRAEDTFGASMTNPIMLKLVGEVEISEEACFVVCEGEAAKIVTGAKIPKGS